MKTSTITVREGERTGDIDWSFDFRSFFDNMGTTEPRKDAACEASKAMLRRIEEDFKAGREVTATTDGGWPRFGWHRVIDVGMYDGWPYWKPVPSVCLLGPLGAEWHSFWSLTESQHKSDETVSKP
jgi:hypothetical protein